MRWNSHQEQLGEHYAEHIEQCDATVIITMLWFSFHFEIGTADPPYIFSLEKWYNIKVQQTPPQATHRFWFNASFPSSLSTLQYFLTDSLTFSRVEFCLQVIQQLPSAN